LTRDSGPELGKTVLLEALGRGKDTLGNPLRLRMPARSTKPSGDRGVIVRPDRSEMVRVGIVGRMVAGERAHPPPAPHVGLHQPVDNSLGAIRRHDSVRQAMTGVGGHRADWPLVAVQPQIVGTLLFPPEALVELLVKAGCPLAHLLGALRIAPNR